MNLRKNKLLTQCHIVSKYQSLDLNLLCSKSILSFVEFDSFKYSDSLKKKKAACVIIFDFINKTHYE